MMDRIMRYILEKILHCHEGTIEIGTLKVIVVGLRKSGTGEEPSVTLEKY
jgi:hypothetical protein